MKAAVYKGNQTIKIEEIDTPEPGPKQVLIKLNFSSLVFAGVDECDV